MRIMSLDMSTRKTGWAVFDNQKLEAYNLIEINGKDIYERILSMYDQLQELITSYNIDKIICEDVPVSVHSNMEVGKNLCILQGCIATIAHCNNIAFEQKQPTHWRSILNLLRSKYTCKNCGSEFEDVSGLDIRECKVCGKSGTKTFSKSALNDRPQLKERAVHLANELCGLNLQYISLNSKQNQDDIAEAILIGYSYLKECGIIG